MTASYFHPDLVEAMQKLGEAMNDSREIAARRHAVSDPKPVRKISLYGDDSGWRGACVCGWQASGWGSKRQALRDAEKHVAAKGGAS